MKSLEWLTEERSGAVKRNVAGCRHRNDNVSGWSAGKWESHRWQLAEKKEKAPNFVTNFMDLLNTCSWHSSQAAQTAGTLSFAR